MSLEEYCCRGKLSAASCNSNYVPSNPNNNCDTILYNYCSTTLGKNDLLCACINSPLAYPDCLDKKCTSTGAFLPKKMVSNRPCPTVLQCNQIINLGDAAKNNLISVEQYQYCSADTSGNKTETNAANTPTSAPAPPPAIAPLLTPASAPAPAPALAPLITPASAPAGFPEMPKGTTSNIQTSNMPEPIKSSNPVPASTIKFPDIPDIPIAIIDNPPAPNPPAQTPPSQTSPAPSPTQTSESNPPAQSSSPSPTQTSSSSPSQTPSQTLAISTPDVPDQPSSPEQPDIKTNTLTSNNDTTAGADTLSATKLIVTNFVDNTLFATKLVTIIIGILVFILVFGGIGLMYIEKKMFFSPNPQNTVGNDDKNNKTIIGNNVENNVGNNINTNS